MKVVNKGTARMLSIMMEFYPQCLYQVDSMVRKVLPPLAEGCKVRMDAWIQVEISVLICTVLLVDWIGNTYMPRDIYIEI